MIYSINTNVMNSEPIISRLIEAETQEDAMAAFIDEIGIVPGTIRTVYLAVQASALKRVKYWEWWTTARIYHVWHDYAGQLKMQCADREIEGLLVGGSAKMYNAEDM